jgi:hypothetical protein
LKKGIIQNDEYLKKSLIEGKEFLIVCKDEKDANSKRVSLYNARRLLCEIDQRKIQIQKLLVDDKWVIRISREKQEVFEVVNGILVPVQEPLRDDSKQMLVEMLGQGMKEEEIVAVLASRGEERNSIVAEIERLSL